MAVQRRPPLRAALDRVKMPTFNRPGTDRADRAERPRLRMPTVRVPSVDELKLRASQVTPETLITFVIVAAAMLFVFLQLQPNLLFAKTTPAGGDMGAHVWGPDYMRHHLLPNLRITGWAPDWYSGFPAYHFYFPLPVADDRPPQLRAALRGRLQADHRRSASSPSRCAPTPSAAWPACASRAR